MKSENYQSKALEIKGVALNITSYQVGEKYFCHISNADPGATIARAEGSSAEKAYETAIAKATARL